MISAVNLRKRYGDNVAVDGVSFEIRRGETFGLLGPNGAGKSTTIGLLVGLLKPDSGSVTLDGGLDPSSPSARTAIGVAPQELSLYEELTAQENLAFFARLYGLSGAGLRDRVGWALEFAGLEDRRRDWVSTYSGGMKRRLNMAVALVHDPQVVLFDEPTVGVDPQSRNHIFEQIEQLKADGRTILYTTHYMEEAQRLCDRVAIMDRGRLLDLDVVNALLERHGGSSTVRAQLTRPPADGASLPAPLDGLSLRFDAERPLEAVAALSAAGVELESLEIKQPNLEAVFLSLTGRSLRD